MQFSIANYCLGIIAKCNYKYFRNSNFTSIKRDKELLISVLLAAVVDIIVNLILVPKLAAVGTAISVIFAEITVLFVQLLMLRKYIPIFIWGVTVYSYWFGYLCCNSYKFRFVSTRYNFFYSCILFNSKFCIFIVYFTLLLIFKEKFTIYIYETIQHKIFK